MIETSPNQALWEKGDFTRLAATRRESADVVVESLGITAGIDMLDLACGDGDTAIPAAQRGANVLGIDIARNLVAAAAKRAEDLGLPPIRHATGGIRQSHHLGCREPGARALRRTATPDTTKIPATFLRETVSV